ncbi:MAG: GGDEF domain-containing protein, partial [Clostridia bacterium]
FSSFQISIQVTRYCLMSLANNYKITTNNYFLKDSLSIALVNGDEALNNLYIQHLNIRDMEFEVTYVDTQEEALQLLVDEKVETILASDTSRDSWMLNYLTTIDREPFYFVSKKGNTEIILELEKAIHNIDVEEPDITETLVSRYFVHNHEGDIILTSDEKLALENYEYFTVGLVKNMEPYQGETDNESSISIQILDCISEIIGKEFRYVFVDDDKELKEKIQNEEIDFIGTLPLDYKLAIDLDVILTKPYITNGVVLLTKDNNQTENALFHMVSDDVLLFKEENLEMAFYVEQAILDLSQNGEYMIFCDQNIAKYHLNELDVPNVVMQSINSMTSDICLGVGKHIDATIIGLLSHATLHLSESRVDEIVYENLIFNNEMTIKEFVQSNFIIFIVLLTLIFTIIIIVVAKNTRKFRDLARKDSLTKLYNAGYFHEYSTEKTLKMQNGCLILIDIDYFKQVNDTYGHHNGDKVIILVGQKLKEICTQYGMVARLGGDEFVVLIEAEVEAQVLEEKCDQILKDLAKNYLEIPITLSIGGYIFNNPTAYDDLYRFADKILYKVKENGRNGYIFDDKI